MADTSTKLTDLLWVGLVPATLTLWIALALTAKSGSRWQRWGWVVASVASTYLLIWLALAGGYDYSLGAFEGFLLLAVPWMGISVLILRGVQGIKHYGWNSRLGLIWWNSILAGLYGGFGAARIFINAQPLSIAAGGMGLIAGVLLARKPPQWPASQPKPIHFLLYALLCASVLVGFLLWDMLSNLNSDSPFQVPFTGGFLVLLAIYFVIMLINAVPRGLSGNKT